MRRMLPRSKVIDGGGNPSAWQCNSTPTSRSRTWNIPFSGDALTILAGVCLESH